ncbi:Porin-like protein GalP, partial [Dissostichus eleginoides]
VADAGDSAVCAFACVCGLIERGLLAARDPTAEEGPHDLLSTRARASEGLWPAAKLDGNGLHSGAKESLGDQEWNRTNRL